MKKERTAGEDQREKGSEHDEKKRTREAAAGSTSPTNSPPEQTQHTRDTVSADLLDITKESREPPVLVALCLSAPQLEI